MHTIWFHLYKESENQNTGSNKQTRNSHRYREQIVARRERHQGDEWNGWRKLVQTSSYKIITGMKCTMGVQFSSVTQSCLTLCEPMNCSTPGPPVHHQSPEFAQTHVHRVGDAIQPSHPLSSTSPPALDISQHQGLFKWVSSLHQVAKVLEFQLQHQSFQWTLRTDLL